MSYSRRFAKAPLEHLKSAFRSVRETLKHLHVSVRIASVAIALFFFDQGWTMAEAQEYLVALVLTALTVLFTFTAVYGWSGIPRQPKITKWLKAILMMVSLLWGVYWTVVILRLKGDKPWGHITRADLFTAGSYIAPIRTLMRPSLLIAFIAGAIISWFIMKRRASNLLCPNKQLHEIAEGDKASIKSLVRIVGILYKPDFGKAYIDFVFSVFNNSLYDIVIDNTIKKGGIRFGEDNEKFYYEPKIEGDKPKYCASRSGTFFILRQAIRAEDIPRFRDTDDVLLYFYDLEIMFHGVEESTGIGPTRLETNHYLQTKKGMWRNWDRLDFVFGYTDEQWADITLGNVEKSGIYKQDGGLIELKAELVELKSENQRLLDIVGEDNRKHRRNLIERWEKLINDAARKYRSDDNTDMSFAEILMNQRDFLSLRQHLSFEANKVLTDNKFDETIRIVGDPGGKMFVNPSDHLEALLSNELLRLQREWGLV
jgi:hypothetical protein